jgi:hypothetical protein
MLADALKSRSRSSNGCRPSQREREREREREKELTENRWSSEHPDTRDNVQQKKKRNRSLTRSC